MTRRNVRKQEWVFPLFSPDFDDRLSLNFHRFVIISCDTRSMDICFVQYCLPMLCDWLTVDIWAQFHRAAKHKAKHEISSLITTGLPTKFHFFCIFLVTGIQLLFAHPENHVKIWLVILFLSRKESHTKQIFVLSSSMKLGPDIDVSDLHCLNN